MPIHRTRILVVDDRKDHGECIARTLWDKHIPVLFINYDEARLVEIEEAGNIAKHHGVRAILLDINLSGSGSANHTDYARAEKVLNTFLDKNNGPWTLITWSTFGGNHPQELYQYLCERLPISIRPISFAVLDKTPYVDGENAIPDDLPVDQREHLASELTDLINGLESLKILGQWERSVYACASEVICNLTTPVLVGGGDEILLNNRLMKIILEIAKAEAGKSIDTHNISDPLYHVLGQILNDRILHSAPSPISFQQLPADTDLLDGSWKYSLNTMLHLELSAKVQGKSQPGSIFIYPSEEFPQSIPSLNNEDKSAFIKDNFICNKFDTSAGEQENKNTILESYNLVLIDITPPCDHAQNKAVWKTFMVGLKVPDANKQWLSQGGKLKGGNIFSLPDFKDVDGSFSYYFNSKLVSAVIDNETELGKLGVSTGRLREQMLREIMNWLGAQITRPGITSFM